MCFLRLFGGVSLEECGDAAPNEALPQRALAILALLATARDSGYSREKLIGYLWPESDGARARHRLADTVYQIRRSLCEDAVLTVGEILRLDSDVVRSDVDAFQDALDAGQLTHAAELYRGPFLDGFFPNGGAEFERWVESERLRLADQYAEVLDKLAAEAEAEGDHARAVGWLKRLAAHDRYNSRYALRLMEALARSGDPGNAIQQGQEHARLLREELGAEPLPEVLELAERLRREAGGYVEAPPREVPESEAAEAGRTPEPRVRRLGGRLALAVTIYSVVSLVIAGAAHVSTLQFGLPGWVFSATVALLFACLPFVLLTAFLDDASAARGWLSWRITVAVIAAAFAVLGLTVSGYMATRALGIGPWGTLIGKGLLEERDLIVLADFEDYTGDPMKAEMVTDLVRLDLEGSPVVGVANRAYVNGMLRQMTRSPDEPLSSELAREVAIRGSLKAVVAGALHRSGSTFVLSARLEAAETGEVLESFRETAEQPDSIISAADRLSARLRERIGESLKSIRASPPLKQVRTPSLEAMRLYTESLRANTELREFRRACDLASRAIAIDTLFAAAYRMRAHCLTNVGIQPAQIIADATRAYELRHQLTLKEQYNTEAVYHQMVTGDWEALINAWSLVLEMDPYWAEAYNQIAGAYETLHDYARAEELYRHRIDLDTLARISRGGLVRSQHSQGKFDEAEETLRQWEEKPPIYPDIVAYNRGILAAASGDYRAAEAHLRRWGDRNVESHLYRARISRHLGRLDQVQGKLAEAETHFRDAMAADGDGERPEGYLANAIELAGMQAWFLGDTARALETIGTALAEHPLESIEPVGRPYPGLAALYAFVGEPQRARELLEEWEAIVPQNLRRLQEVPRRLGWASVAMAEGRPEDALAELRFAQERDRCPICQLPLFGQLYESLGQADSAVAVYERYVTTPYAERCLTTPYLRRALGGVSAAAGFDPYWLPVVYERLGDLYEQRGEAAKAVLYYGKLVELWKDADPELQPRVQAARRPIETLSPDT
ncbi:MAG: BTAD domain-containing putative transcriptional regulator [Gemmatimonadales bacterium]|jgi:DNA-binding SARP family transcriptional activator/tetratricopeptide (TPR) repeat protein